MKRLYLYVMFCILATAGHAQYTLGTYLRNAIQTQEKGFLVAARLIEACGLCDSLDAVRDNEYEERYMRGMISDYNSYTGWNNETFYAPQHRNYGFTLFAETDDFWEQALGKEYTDIQAKDVADYIQQNCFFAKSYNSNDDYSSTGNVLYQFVTYHLLNRRLTPEHLVNHYNEMGYDLNRRRPSAAVCEYYTTMGDRRLLQTFESAESDGVCLNRFPELDNSREGTYREIGCYPEKAGIRVGELSSDLLNGAIYPIDGLLAFDEMTAHNMGRTRLRMDVASIFPEMANNNIRLSGLTDSRHMNVFFPCSNYPYLDDLKVSGNTEFCYSAGFNQGWSNMQGDEFTCKGYSQDMTLRLPPVPTNGTYELRMATFSGSTNRGIYQLYFGTDPDNLSPLSMPIDFRQSGDNTLHTGSGYIANNIGYVADIPNDDTYNQMRDNELRENGYMKGCQLYIAGAPGGKNTLRGSTYCLRRILGRMKMDSDKTYYLRFKSMTGDETKSLWLDYIEFCPESVYDNPYVPEDIW